MICLLEAIPVPADGVVPATCGAAGCSKVNELLALAGADVRRSAGGRDGAGRDEADVASAAVRGIESYALAMARSGSGDARISA